MHTKIALIIIIFIHNFSLIYSSEGDQSPMYRKCVNKCKSTDCWPDGRKFTTEAWERLDDWCKVLGWSCEEDCRYRCMWRAVYAMQARGWAVPKFHGKWPFKRMVGMQEPASVLCSVLNLAAHVFMYSKILRDPRLSVKQTPMLRFWHLFFFVCAHAWLWSAVFHARDTPGSELMDYACALSMVLALFAAGVVRVRHAWDAARGPATAALALTLVLYALHVRYLLAEERLDYVYNMAVNVCAGIVGSLVWLALALRQLWRGERYAWRMLVFVQLSGAALLLELFDFPPAAHTWDAHALWHLSTAPLVLLFYRFVIDDLVYLQEAKLSQKSISKLA